MNIKMRKREDSGIADEQFLDNSENHLSYIPLEVDMDNYSSSGVTNISDLGYLSESEYSRSKFPWIIGGFSVGEGSPERELETPNAETSYTVNVGNTSPGNASYTVRGDPDTGHYGGKELFGTDLGARYSDGVSGGAGSEPSDDVRLCTGAGAVNQTLTEDIDKLAKLVLGSHVTSLEIWVEDGKWRKLALASEVTFDLSLLRTLYNDFRIVINPKPSFEKRWGLRDRKKKRSLAYCGTLMCGLAIMFKFWDKQTKFTTVQRMDRKKDALLKNFRIKYGLGKDETDLAAVECKTDIKIILFNAEGRVQYFSGFKAKKQVMFYVENERTFIIREFSGFQRIK